MYSSHMLDSHTLFGARPTHGSYRAYNSSTNFTPQLLSPHDRYYRALAEARSAELEILEGARREEVLLQRRLEELRKTRVEQLRQDYSYAPYSTGHTPVDLSPYDRSHLEALRLQVQEEERLAKLEASQRKFLKERNLRAAIEDNNNSRGISLLEEAGLSHKLGIPKRADTSYLSPAVTNEALFTISPPMEVPAHSFFGHPRIKHSHSQKKSTHFGDSATHFDARRLHPGVFSVNQREEEPKVPFQPRTSRQDEPPMASTPIDLNGILELLGLSAPKNATHHQGESSTHQSKGSNGREEISGTQSQGLAETYLFTKAENPKQEKHEKSFLQASQLPELNLKEQLEKRLKAEHENEVRDTIEAVLNSLYDIQLTSKGNETSSTQSLRASAKGKEKEYEPSPDSNKLSTSQVADNARLQIKEIEKQFYSLEREFMFPANVDFITPVPTGTDSTSVTSSLAFTASNQPIRFFEQSLSQLLTKLDLIESQGNEELRSVRKDVVQKVEYALEDLEKEVEERLRAKVARVSKRRSVTVEDVTSPDEHLSAEVVSSSPQIDVKTVAIGDSVHPTPDVVSGETAETSPSLSTQISFGEHVTTPNPVDEESPEQDQESIATESLSQESTLPIDSSDIVPSADSPARPLVSLGPDCSESKEVHPADDRDSGANTTVEKLVDQIQSETLVQETPSTESQNAEAAGLPASTGSDTRTSNGTDEAVRERSSDETSEPDISDVESASSDWSEVDAGVAQ